MKRIMCTTLAALALTALPGAHAANETPLYIGAAVGTSGDLNFSVDGTRIDSNKPRPVKLYAGFDLNERFALEAGYTRFGGFEFPGQTEFDMSALHLAFKAAIPLGESFSVFGKVGVSRLSGDLIGQSISITETDVRPLVGLGAAYRFNENLSLTLEVTSYGSLKRPGMSVRARPVELGLKYRF